MSSLQWVLMHGHERCPSGSTLTPYTINWLTSQILLGFIIHDSHEKKLPPYLFSPPVLISLCFTWQCYNVCSSTKQAKTISQPACNVSSVDNAFTMTASIPTPPTPPPPPPAVMEGHGGGLFIRGGPSCDVHC